MLRCDDYSLFAGADEGFDAGVLLSLDAAGLLSVLLVFPSPEAGAAGLFAPLAA